MLEIRLVGSPDEVAVAVEVLHEAERAGTLTVRKVSRTHTAVGDAARDAVRVYVYAHLGARVDGARP